MFIGGTLIVFDSVFVSMGFGPFKTFAGKALEPNAYSALGAAGISSVQAYFMLIAAVGVLIGSGSAYKLQRAKINGNMVEYQRIMNSFIPQNIMMGVIVGVFLLFLAKPLIYVGSGAQSMYASN